MNLVRNMSGTNLRISFVLPFKSLNGGVKIVLEYANRLQELGHDVTVLYPLVPYYFGANISSIQDRLWQLRGLVANIVRGNRVNWFELKARLHRVPWISEYFVPDADIVVATAWPTAYSVNSLPVRKGRKFYFIQQYETWSGSLQEVEGSYGLPLQQIVIASWLRQLMKEKFNQNATLVPNAIDQNVFYNQDKKFNEKPRILVMYSSLEHKGFEFAMQAVELVKEQHRGINLVVFGTKKWHNTPNDAEFHLKPSPAKLRELYSTSDIFLWPSLSEGWPLPPMEAMACKCAVVASNVGGLPDYVISGKTALTFEPQDVTAMAQHVNSLLSARRKLERISYAGYEYIQRFTWDAAVRKMNAVFLNETNGEESLEGQR